MKVRCIADDTGIWRVHKYFLFVKWWGKCNGPKSGDILTVSSEYWDEGKLYYNFIEWPVEDGGGFDAEEFEPIDENYEQIKYSEVVKEKTPCAN